MMRSRIIPYSFFNEKFWIFIIGFFVTIVFSMLQIEHLFPFLVLSGGILLAAVIISSEAREEFDKIFFLFIIGLLIRVLASYFLYSVMTVAQVDEKNRFFIEDGYNYSLNGWTIAMIWSKGVSVNLLDFVSRFGSASGTISNYDFLNAVVYSAAGYSYFSMFFINCVAGSLAIVFIYLITSKMFSKTAAYFSAALCAFWPSFVLWSSQNLKDPITVLCALCFIYFLMKLKDNIKFSTMIFLPLSLAGLFYIRIALLVPLMIAAIIFFILSFKGNVFLKFILFFLIASVIFNFFSQAFSSYFKAGILEELSANRSVKAYGNLAYFSDFRFTSWWSLIKFLPLGLFAVWFCPFPWQIFSLNQLFAAPEIVAWYLLMPFAVKGFYLAVKNKLKDSYMPIAVILISSIFLGFYEGNIGTLYRHKAIVTVLAFIFISAGLNSREVVVKH